MAKKDIQKFTDKLTDEFQKVEKDPEVIIAYCETLKGVAGWQHVKEVLKQKADDIQSEILDTDTQGEELNRLRDRRDLILWFINLPEILIKYFQETPQMEQRNLDPYEKPEE